MAPKVLAGKRQHERDGAVARLETARLAARAGSVSSDDLRAASELAQHLLGTEIAGDARLAWRVIVWAGRPAHGFQVRLRTLFDAAIARNGRVFGQSEMAKLAEMGLLTPHARLRRRSRRN